MPWKEPDPEKDRARRRLNKAIAAGFIVKPKVCSECGKTAVIHGHHENYDEEYKVIWLCGSCHNKLHHKLRLAA